MLRYAIYRGITTGLNEAFIIDNRTKEALVNADPKSAEILKPVVRGRDIRRYRAQWASLWLIDTHNGHGDTPAINIDDFPAVKAHLDGYYPRLAKRYDKGTTPYNLRNCAYHADFAGEKLFWMDLTDTGRFAYEDGERFCLNTVFMMTGQALKYHCAVLNSKLVTWFMSHTALNSGMGVTRWIGHTVEQIPVLDATDEQRDLLVRQVNQVLEQKAADPATDTKSHEDEINRLVYTMYGLTDDEIAAVDEGYQAA